MRRLAVILICIVIQFIFTSAALCEIDFRGNVALSDRELLNAIDPGYGPAEIAGQIRTVYQNLGYFDAEVESDYIDRSRNRVIVINEGRLSRIGAIDLDIAPESLGVILSGLRNRYTGLAASRTNFEQFAKECIELLANSGMPFARGEWTGFSLSATNDIIAGLRIIPGPRTIISDIEFDGTGRTRPQTLEKAAGLKTGGLFSRDEVIRSEKMINKLPYVVISSPYYLESSTNGDSCTIVYNIRELPSTRIEGFGGLINASGKTDFIGRVNFEFGDILGTGRMFSLFWNKKDVRSNELSIKYVEPFIFNSRFNLELEAFQIDRDTLFITTGGKASLIHRFGVYLTGILYTSIERTVPESGSDISRSIKRSLGSEFDYFKTDFDLNPRTGYEIGSELEYRYRSNSTVREGQNPPSNITAAGSKGAIYFNPVNRFVAATSFQGWGIVSANGTIPSDEYRFIGGVNDLRGYSEEQFPAYRYAILSAEPRLITGRYSRAYLYGDFGLIKASQNTDDDYDFKPGYGLGLVSRTRIGQVRVEIGWGDENFPNDAVFNFGIEGRF